MMKAWLTTLLIACIAPVAHADMSAADAFNSGSSFGKEANTGVGTGISSDAASTTVPNYSASSPRSALYGGMKNLGPDGVSETVYCQGEGASAKDSKTKTACDATNLMTDFHIHKPVIHIDKELDPLMVKRREIYDDPTSASLPIASSTSECKPLSTTTADQTREDICYDMAGMPITSACQMPYEVDVVQHNRYQCDEGKPGTTHSCSKTLLSNCSSGCFPDGIRLVTYSGFGGLVTTNAGEGYYYLNLGTVNPDGSVHNNYFSGYKYKMYEANYTISIDKIRSIDTFSLDNVTYDDSTAIWINGVFVWGNKGGATLDTCTYDEFSTDADGNTVITAISGATNGVDTCTRSASYWNISGSSRTTAVGELKSYLKEGTNEIRVRLLVGDNGEVRYQFKTLYSCGCKKEWVNGCATYE